MLPCLSYDLDQVVNTAGNGIAAAVWTLSDGSEFYGTDAYYQFPSNGSFPVTLTVYDCKGQTSSITKMCMWKQQIIKMQL